ncbi:MAG: hypothetical protein M3Y08_19790 [Fibrobacterota bacterium]|nr:hypothetical protein [Fibrobacterota bacterium]
MTSTEKSRKWRKAHPEKAREYYRISRQRRKERKEAEKLAKREKMAAILAEFQKVRGQA